MRHLPIFLELGGKAAIVVGGGVVAARRAEHLIKAGARVTTFAPALSDDFRELLDAPNFRHAARDPQPQDFEGSAVCFVALEDERLSADAWAAAKRAGAWVNVADRPQFCDFIMPAIIDRDPLVIAISTGGASPILGRMLKARLETVIPAAYGRLADLMGGFREAVGKAIASPIQRRRFWETVLEGPIAERALSGDESAAAAELTRVIERVGAESAEAPRGEVYLVGAGPGDPDLLTFRALRLMQKADVVLYHRLTDQHVMNLVRREAGAHLCRQAAGGPRIAARRDQRAPGQARQARQEGAASQGRRSVRIRSRRRGDRGARRRGDPVSGLSGITAAIGAAAYAGIPLTHRDHAQACVFVTGHGKDGKIDLDWTAPCNPARRLRSIWGCATSRR